MASSPRRRTAALHPRLRPDLRHERAQSDGMALVDRALQAPDYDEEIAGPAQDEEFVLAHADNVEAPASSLI